MRNDRFDTEIPWGPRNGKQLVGRESECNLTAIGDNYWRQIQKTGRDSRWPEDTVTAVAFGGKMVLPLCTRSKHYQLGLIWCVVAPNPLHSPIMVINT